MEAVVWDMDGLMIDSEPHWVRAEIAAFAKVGITLTTKDCEETTGLRIDMVRPRGRLLCVLVKSQQW